MRHYNDDAVITHLFKSIKHATLIVNCCINYGHWVIMMCQCRFINCYECTTLVADVDNCIGYACVGQVSYGKSLDLPLDFAVNIKLL